MGPISPNVNRYRYGTLLLIAAAAILRVLYLACWCPLDLATDEAHYWDWSRHLDWCYYSKGPLVAWLIRLSCACFGDTMLAVRLPAVACGSLLLGGLYVLTLQIHSSEKLAFAVVALAQTLPIVAAGSVLMTIDAPFTCAWMWALVFAARAALTPTLTPNPSPRRRGVYWCWFAAGVCILLGVLAKHTMVLFVPCFLLFLATTPALRGLLHQPGCWIMTGIGALGGLPILAWNACNGWVTVKHSQAHAGLDDDSFIHWLGPLRYLGAQFAVVLGFWFIAWARAVWTHRPTRETKPELCFLWWMSVPTFVFFALFSWKNGGGGTNWPVAAYLTGMVLVAGCLARDLRDARLWFRRVGQASLAMTACIGLLLIAILHQPIELQPIMLSIGSAETAPSRRLDPTLRLRGWRHLASDVDRVRAELQARGIDPVLASERWTQTGTLGFYCEGRPTAYTLGMLFNDRSSQCDLWRPNPIADPATFHGRTFIVVNMNADQLRGIFTSVEPTRLVEYRESGRLIATWPVTIGHGFRKR